MKRVLHVLVLILVPCFGMQHQASAASAAEINVSVNETLKKFNADVEGGDVFLKKAQGVLVFPKVYKAGIGIGGEYGEGGHCVSVAIRSNTTIPLLHRLAFNSVPRPSPSSWYFWKARL